MDFTVVTVMGVITDGKKGTELQAAMELLYAKLGIKTIRLDTTTARSFEYNASRIIVSEAVAQDRWTDQTPEALEMIMNLLSKQSGCDSQVHVYDAVGVSGLVPSQPQWTNFRKV